MATGDGVPMIRRGPVWRDQCRCHPLPVLGASDLEVAFGSLLLAEPELLERLLQLNDLFAD